MTGSNLNEFVNGVGHPELNGMDEAEMLRRVEEGLHGDTKAIVAAYRREYPGATPFQLYATIAASSARQAVFEQARRKAALGGAPAYSYIYSWRTPTLDDRPGSFHAAELAFVFDNGDICDHYSTLSSASLALSRQMSSAWVSFARNGDPNHAAMPRWPAYSDATRAVMDFNTESRVRMNPEAEGLKLIGPPV
jgi:para-nitrobenzyl esterase